MTKSDEDRGEEQPGQRARNKAALAKRILDAARAAFVADGVNDADLADIARRAEVGRATLYRYFDGKDALLRALMAEDWDAQAGLFARLAREAVVDAASVSAWLRLLLRATAARLTSFPIYFALGPGPRMEGLRRQRERLLDTLGERFPAFAVSPGGERVEALLLLFQIEEFVAHAAGAPDPLETERGVELLAERLLALMARTASAEPRALGVSA